jgi:hypothetical protein
MSKPAKKIKLSYDAASQSGSGAFLAHFTNSFTDLDTIYSGAQGLQFNAFDNTNAAKSGQRILVGENGRMNYIGTNYGKSSEKHDPCK